MMSECGAAVAEHFHDLPNATDSATLPFLVKFEFDSLCVVQEYLR
jgi:hypothetical protein